MKTLTVLAAVLLLAAGPVGATPVSYDTPQNEQLGEACAMGDYGACDALVEATGGRCAGPVWSQCQYNDETLLPAYPGLTTWVPGYGHSRVETVQACLEDAGVGRFQDLITDSHFEIFNGCLESYT